MADGRSKEVVIGVEEGFLFSNQQMCELPYHNTVY